MQRSSTPITRHLCVFALLLGLIGMHGLTQGQGDGCHGGAAVTPMTTAMPVGDAAGPHLIAAMHGMGSGCVSLRSAGWPAIALLLLAITGLIASSETAAMRSIEGRCGRSPPVAGVSLLRRVCVSLT